MRCARYRRCQRKMSFAVSKAFMQEPKQALSLTINDQLSDVADYIKIFCAGQTYTTALILRLIRYRQRHQTVRRKMTVRAAGLMAAKR